MRAALGRAAPATGEPPDRRAGRHARTRRGRPRRTPRARRRCCRRGRSPVHLRPADGRTVRRGAGSRCAARMRKIRRIAGADPRARSGTRRCRAGQGQPRQPHEARRQRARRSARRPPDAVRPRAAIRQPVHPVQPVPLHHVPLGRRVPDRADRQLHSRAAADPLAEVGAAAGPADPPRRSGAASDREEGHAHDGRRADPVGADDLHAALGGSAQRLCLVGAVRHAGLRRARLRRRLPETVAAQPQGRVGPHQADRADGDRPARRDLDRDADARRRSAPR